MNLRNNIKRLRTDNDWTQEQLAKKIGVARSTVTQWESGWSNPRMGMVVKLADVFGVRPSVVLGEKPVDPVPDNAVELTSSGLATVPVLGRVHAGNPQDIENVDRVMEVPQSVLDHHPNSFGLIVEGDCMDKVYPEGSLIVIDMDMKPKNGSIGAIRLDGFKDVMRRVHIGANTLILSPESWNSDHTDIVVTEDSDTSVEYIGTVVWFQASEEID